MTDTLINSRIRLEYYDQNESFATYLPVLGTIQRRCIASTGPNDWYLVELEKPIDYQHQIGSEYQFKRLVIPQVLIRSRWEDEPISNKNSPSVFLLLVPEDLKFEQKKIDTNHFINICWAQCHVL